MLQDVSEDFQRWWIRTHVQVAWGTVRKPVCIRPDFRLHEIFCHSHKQSTNACAVQMMSTNLSSLCVQLILEEFGKWLNSSVNATMDERNKYFGIVYDECQSNMDLQGSSLKVRSP